MNTKSEFENYSSYIEEQAELLVEDYIDNIKEDILDGDLDGARKFIEERVHEHVDNDFIYVYLIDSAHIIEQSDNVEIDSGLWEGQEPMDAIKTQAFFTYRTDLILHANEEVKSILDEYLVETNLTVGELQEELNDMEENTEMYDEKSEEIETLEEIVDRLEDAIDEL